VCCKLLDSKNVGFFDVLNFVVVHVLHLHFSDCERQMHCANVWFRRVCLVAL
jgi:hypothetical protein